MKLNLLILTLLLCSCASRATKSSSKPLEYSEIKKFAVTSTTEKDVIAALGPPATRVEQKEFYQLEYPDKSGFQRLSLRFSSQDNKLSSFLWIPRVDEKEASLDQVKSEFANAHFKEVPDARQVSHVVSKGASSYVDEKSGISFRYDKDRNVVEAISFYESNNRQPAKEAH